MQEKNKPVKNIVIISITSDIAVSLAREWKHAGQKIVGTFRKPNLIPDDLKDNETHFFQCDLQDEVSCNEASEAILEVMPNWDILLFATGTLNPIGTFLATDIDAWSNAIQINFTNQMRLTHRLMNGRLNDKRIVDVIYFSGSGSNGPANNYSAYTVSKIALMKMCELLDAEIPWAKFSIIGPGFVKTKIQRETLLAGTEKAGEQYSKTLKMMESTNSGTAMAEIVAFIDWVIAQPKNIVGGRNFSIVYDDIMHPDFIETIKTKTDMYKLRRFMTSSFVRS